MYIFLYSALFKKPCKSFFIVDSVLKLGKGGKDGKGGKGGKLWVGWLAWGNPKKGGGGVGEFINVLHASSNILWLNYEGKLNGGGGGGGFLIYFL